MRKLIPTLWILLLFINAFAQKSKLQELKEQLANHPQQDTFRVNRLNKIALRRDLSTAGRDSAADEALLLARKLGYKEGEARALIAQAQTKDIMQAIDLKKQALVIAEKTGSKSLISETSSELGFSLAGTEQKDLALHYLLNGVAVAQSTNDKVRLAYAQEGLSQYYVVFIADYVKALDWGLKALHTAEQSNDINALAKVWGTLAPVYSSLGDDTTSLSYYQKAVQANEKIGNTTIQALLLNNKGELYRLSGKYPEALKAYQAARAITNDDAYVKELLESNEADVYDRMGDYPTAKQYAFSSLSIARKRKDPDMMSWIYGILGRISLHTNQPDSALYYGNMGYNAAVQMDDLETKRDNSQVLADAYARKKIFDKAYTFQNLYISYRDSMMNSDVKNQASLIKYNADLQKKQAEIAALNKDKQLQKAEAQRQFYLLMGALAALLLIAALVLVLYRNNLHKQKANNLLQKQKLEIQNQRDQTNQALAELQAAQHQLVQSEKMASLGELTAGIAHEIQNPLNFVNNFSEVNTELIGELKEVRTKINGERDEVLVEELLDDIEQNLQKILHHGKRADSIVKGMLQHSRMSTGQKELTDVNALADECLRLSYHGLRAKDKTFNANITTDFDVRIGKINIVPQEISRVLINILNNAFYAVNEKKKTTSEGYAPFVAVCTKKENDKVAISIKDNGNGIPQHVIDKIFQPFFTTKPAGQGTGLGLSLSYDIVKANGGEIKVESKEGEGTEFIIELG